MFVMKEGFAECWVFDDYEHDVRFVGRNFRALMGDRKHTGVPPCRSPK
jgi:hypothetical protein